MKSISLQQRSALLLVCALVFWASNVVIARAFRAELTPFWLAFWRWFTASLVLMPFALRPLYMARKRFWLARYKLLFLALIGIVGNNALIYLGVATASATSAAALQTFTPVWICILGAIFLKRHLPWSAWLGVALSVMGALTIAVHGRLQDLLAFQFGVGEMWLLGASLCWAIYTLVVGTLPKGLNARALLWVLMVLGSAMLLPMAMVFEPHTLLPNQWSVHTLLAVVYLGVFPSVLAYVFYNSAISVMGSAKTGNYMNLLPAFSSLLSVAFLGESLYFFHVFGFLAIIAGITLSSGKFDWNKIKQWLENRHLVSGRF